MSFDNASLIVVVDGQQTALGAAMSNQLARAVIISLFTWRRANPDDSLPNNQRMGWWGDSFPPVENDRIGSRLWLLSRAKVVPETRARAKEYADEALRWLVEDGVAARAEVSAERYGRDGIALNTILYRKDGSKLLDLRFVNLWEFLHV